MQEGMDWISHACDNFDLIISTTKTEVVHQPAPEKPYNESVIIMKAQLLQVVDKITYLADYIELSRIEEESGWIQTR